MRLFFQMYLRSKEVSTFQTKWLRIKGSGEQTNVHSDYYRFEGLGDSLHIAWIPLSKVQVT